MNDIFVGNMCSLCAMVSDSVSSTQKKPNRVLAVQIVSQVFYAAGSIILKGYSSTVQNAVAVLRNLAAMKNVKSRVVEWILILAGGGLGIWFNNRGLLGGLPIVANLEYSVAVFRFKDSVSWLKAAFLLNAVMYFVFNLVIMNYVGAAANVIVIITTVVFMIRNIRAGRPGSEQEKAGEKPEEKPERE